jgi:hypothetical protein
MINPNAIAITTTAALRAALRRLQSFSGVILGRQRGYSIARFVIEGVTEGGTCCRGKFAPLAIVRHGCFVSRISGRY